MEKKAFVTKEMIEKIVEKYPTPFHIYDEKGIRENAEGSFCVEQGLQGVLCGKGDSQPFSDQHLKRLRLWM